MARETIPPVAKILCTRVQQDPAAIRIELAIDGIPQRVMLDDDSLDWLADESPWLREMRDHKRAKALLKDEAAWIAPPLPPFATVRTISRWANTNQVVLQLDAGGRTYRFALDDEALTFLAEELPVQRWKRRNQVTVVKCADHPVLTKDQSAISSGMPNRDVSPNEGHMQPPSATAAAALDGE